MSTLRRIDVDPDEVASPGRSLERDAQTKTEDFTSSLGDTGIYPAAKRRPIQRREDRVSLF
ncbi:MAG: hypothetical protein HYV60_14745 [Planctomycetia bacterium]|nr:hypothetical protein [Planctomycetia bacterium]